MFAVITTALIIVALATLRTTRWAYWSILALPGCEVGSYRSPR
jgi:hypothetical protein